MIITHYNACYVIITKSSDMLNKNTYGEKRQGQSEAVVSYLIISTYNQNVWYQIQASISYLAIGRVYKGA